MRVRLRAYVRMYMDVCVAVFVYMCLFVCEYGFVCVCARLCVLLFLVKNAVTLMYCGAFISQECLSVNLLLFVRSVAIIYVS